MFLPAFFYFKNYIFSSVINKHNVIRKQHATWDYILKSQHPELTQRAKDNKLQHQIVQWKLNQVRCGMWLSILQTKQTK